MKCIFSVDAQCLKCMGALLLKGFYGHVWVLVYSKTPLISEHSVLFLTLEALQMNGYSVFLDLIKTVDNIL